MVISDPDGSRLAVLFNTSDEALRKAGELQSAGFEPWRMNGISYTERVEQWPEPPETGSAGPATASTSERVRRFERDLALLLETFGPTEARALATGVAVNRKTLLVMQPGSNADAAVRILDSGKAA